MQSNEQPDGATYDALTTSPIQQSQLDDFGHCVLCYTAIGPDACFCSDCLAAMHNFVRVPLRKSA